MTDALSDLLHSDRIQSETVADAGHAIRHILVHCGYLEAGERVVIVSDDDTAGIAAAFEQIAREITPDVQSLSIPRAPVHGVEPPAAVAGIMTTAGLIVGLTYTSMAHTHARLRACKEGARYLSLPEYCWSLLGDPALLTNFRAQAPLVRRVADAFSAGESVRVTTALGTDIQLDINGRRGNCCPGTVEHAGELGSPPDIEANVSPIEDGSRGVIVVDGSIPCAEIGLLSSPVTLHVASGRIQRIESDDMATVRTLDAMFANAGSERAKILAECGIGLNPLARLQGIMLTDEGALGCVHFGFGSNATVGGRNDIPFHLDFCVRDGTLDIDGARHLAAGSLV